LWPPISGSALGLADLLRHELEPERLLPGRYWNGVGEEHQAGGRGEQERVAARGGDVREHGGPSLLIFA
jgi:hypothetical protein